MKLKQLLSLTALALVAVLTGCSSGPTIKNDSGTYQKIVQSPEIVAPEWMDNPPKGDKNNLYVTGTADSVNYGSSRQKALLDAQMHLGDKVNGELNAMVQQYKNDVGNSYIENTTTNIKKLIAETDLSGYNVEKISTIKIDGKFQTFVLLHYPIGDANEVLKQKLAIKQQRESVMRAAQGQIDLSREMDRKAQREMARDRRTQEIVAPDTLDKGESVVTPVTVEKVGVVNPDESKSELNLMPVDNAEYKQKRAEALQKPGAVVGQVTVR
jgi:hypothetical protein